MKLPELYSHQDELAKAPGEIQLLVRQRFSPIVVQELEKYRGPKFRLLAIAPILNGIAAHLQQLKVKYGLQNRLSGPVLFSDEDADTCALYFRTLTTIDTQTSTAAQDLGPTVEMLELEPHAFFFVVNCKVPTWAMAFELMYLTGTRCTMPEEEGLLGASMLDNVLRLSRCNFVSFSQVDAKTTPSSDFQHFLEHKGTQDGSAHEQIKELLKADLDVWDLTLAIEAARQNTINHASLGERAEILNLFIAQTMICLRLASGNAYEWSERAGTSNLTSDLSFLVQRVLGLADFQLLGSYPDVRFLFSQCLFKSIKKTDTVQETINYHLFKKPDFLPKLLELGDASILDQLARAISNTATWVLTLFTPASVARMLQSATGECMGPVLRLCNIAISRHSAILGKPENIAPVVTLVERSESDQDALSALEFLAELIELNPTETVRVVHDTPILRLLLQTVHKPVLSTKSSLVLGRLLEQDQITYSLISSDMWKSLATVTEAFAAANICAGMSTSETGQKLIGELGLDKRLIELILNDCFEGQLYSETMVSKFVDTLLAVPGYLNQMVEQIEPMLGRLKACLDASADHSAYELRGYFKRNSAGAHQVSHVILLLGSLAHQRLVQDKLHAHFELLVECLMHPKLPMHLLLQYKNQKYFITLFDELFSVDRAVGMLEMCFERFSEFVQDPMDAKLIRTGALFFQVYFSFKLKKSDVFAQHIVPIILANPVYKQLAQDIPRQLAAALEREAECLSKSPELTECFWAVSGLVHMHQEDLQGLNSEYEMFKLLDMDVEEYCRRKFEVMQVRNSRRILVRFFDNMMYLARTACQCSLLVPGLYLPGETVAGLIKAMQSQQLDNSSGRYVMAAMLDICCNEVRSTCFAYDFIQFGGLECVLEIYQRVYLSKQGQALFVDAVTRDDYRQICLKGAQWIFANLLQKLSGALEKHLRHRVEEVESDWVIEPCARALLAALNSLARGVPALRSVTEMLSAFDTEYDLKPMEPVLAFIEQNWRQLLAKADPTTNHSVVLIAQCLISLQYSFRDRFDALLERLQADQEAAPLLAAMAVMQPENKFRAEFSRESSTHVQAILSGHAGLDVDIYGLISRCSRPSDVYFLGNLVLSRINEQRLEPSVELFESLAGLSSLVSGPQADRYCVLALLSLKNAIKTILETDFKVMACGITRTITQTVADGQTTLQLDPLLRPCLVANPELVQQRLEALTYVDPDTNNVYLKGELHNNPTACCSHEDKLGPLAEHMLLWSVRRTIQHRHEFCDARDRALGYGIALYEFGGPGRRPFVDIKLDKKIEARARYVASWNAFRQHLFEFRFACDLVLPHCPSLGNLIGDHSPLLREYFTALVDYSNIVQRREGLVISEFVLSEALATGSDALINLVLDSLADAMTGSERLSIVSFVLLEASSSAHFCKMLERHPILAKFECMIEDEPARIPAKIARKNYFTLISLLFEGQGEAGPKEDTEEDKQEESVDADENEPATDDEANDAADGTAEGTADDTEDLDSLADGLLDDSDQDSEYYESSYYESLFTLNDYADDDMLGRVMVAPPRQWFGQYPALFSMSTVSDRRHDNTLEYEVCNVMERTKPTQQPFYWPHGSFDNQSKGRLDGQFLGYNLYTPRQPHQAYGSASSVSWNAMACDKYFNMCSIIRWNFLSAPNHASAVLCKRLLEDNWSTVGRTASIDWSRVAQLPGSFDEFRKEVDVPEGKAKEVAGHEDRQAALLRAAVELVHDPSLLKAWGLDEQVVMALPEDMRLEVVASHLLAADGPDMTAPEILETLDTELFTDVAYTQPDTPHVLELERKRHPLDLAKVRKRNKAKQHLVKIDFGTRLMCVLAQCESKQRGTPGESAMSGLWTSRLRLLAIGYLCDQRQVRPLFDVNLVVELENSSLDQVPLDTLLPLLLKPAIFYHPSGFTKLIEFIKKQKPKDGELPGRASLDTIFALLCSRIIDQKALKKFIKLLLHLKDKKLLLPEAIEQYTCDELKRLLDASMASAANGNIASSIFASLDILLSRLVTFQLCSLDRNLDLMVSLAESLGELIPQALTSLNESSLSLLRSYMYVTFVAPQTIPAFIKLFESHGAAINNALLESPALLGLCIKTLKNNYHVFSLDVKLKNLYSAAPKLNDSALKLATLRNHLFSTAYRKLGHLSGSALAKTKLEIEFTGELGMDGGGLLREWFSLLGEDMLDENYGLFKELDGVYHPNVHSAVENFCELYEFLGKMMAKAVLSKEPLGCNLSRVVYEAIVKQPDHIGLGLDDLAVQDPALARSLKWMQDNEIAHVLDETFVASSSEFGERKQHDLKPNGSSIAVTDDNKDEYISLLVRHKLLEGVRSQLQSLCRGFYSVIPHKTTLLFDANEMGLMICGTRDIDVEAWKNATTFSGYDANSPQVKWLWQFVRTLSTAERGELLRFATGSPMLQRPVKFVISRAWQEEGLPTASVCGKTINVPTYRSYADLAANLRVAIEHSRGFGLI